MWTFVSMSQHYGNLLGMLVLYKHHHRVVFSFFYIKTNSSDYGENYMAIGKGGHVDVNSQLGKGGGSEGTKQKKLSEQEILAPLPNPTPHSITIWMVPYLCLFKNYSCSVNLLFCTYSHVHVHWFSQREFNSVTLSYYL